jgi:hypothetical protein
VSCIVWANAPAALGWRRPDVKENALIDRSRSSPPLRSVEAYVLPDVVEVTAGARGIIRSVRFAPRDVVFRGQTVATFEPLRSRGKHDRGVAAVTSPMTGMVTRCWVNPDDEIGRASPLVCIASSENVLVSAKFPAGSSLRLGHGARAVVRCACESVPATIVSIIRRPGSDDREESEARITRVVLAVSIAPFEALWPGTPVQVEIRS